MCAYIHISFYHLLFPKVATVWGSGCVINMSCVYPELKRSISQIFIPSKIEILRYVSQSVVYIVAHVGFLNTSRFNAQTCF